MLIAPSSCSWLSSWPELEHLDLYDLEPCEMPYDNLLADLFSFGPMTNNLRSLKLAVRAYVTRPLYRTLVVASAKTLQHLTIRFDDDGWMDEAAIQELIGYVASSLDTFEYRFQGTDDDLSTSCTQLVHALNALERVRHLCLPIEAITNKDVTASLQALDGLQELTVICNGEGSYISPVSLTLLHSLQLRRLCICGN